MNRMISVCLIFAISMVSACKDLAHDNPLDPDNPNGRADQVVVVENFIIKNTKVGVTAPPYNQNSQDALYNLTDIYKEKMLLLEYHMIPVDTTYADSLGMLDNEFRYNNEYRGGANRGFPHTYFNGRQTGVQGASNVELVRSRYQSILDSATAEKVRLYCYAEKNISGNNLLLNIQVVRYGEETDLLGVRIEYIVFEDGAGDSDNFTVRKISAPISENLPAGRIVEIPEQTIDMTGINPNGVGVVVLIKDPTSKKVLQANRAR